MAPFRILSHRALLDGPAPERENTLDALAQATASGFDVEVDVNVDPLDGRLVLAHDPARWTPEREPDGFLPTAAPGALHALNVKSLAALDDLLPALERAGTANRFFLFDFELLGGDRALMRSVQERGFRVAHRLSEREPRLDDYLGDPTVTTVWLDELDGPWARREHVQALAADGKEVFCVSPDLHGRREPEALRRRWAELHDFGAAGICTDYPLALRELVGGTS